MSHSNQHRAQFWLLCLYLALIMGTSLWSVLAQDTSPTLTQTTEYNIGLDCPVAAALDPAGTTYWILMDNCFQFNYSLHAYNLTDGTQVNTKDYAAALESLNGVFVDPFITPMGFTPAGDVSIRYNDPDTYASTNMVISVATSGEAVTLTSDSYDALLASYSEYPEFSTYSPDHTRVIAVGSTSLHILDVQAETEIVEIPAGGSTDNTIASFSSDSTQLHLVRFNTAPESDDHSSTLLIYSLPDGTLLNEYSVESSSVWVSPDGTQAAIQRFSNNVGDLNEIVVVDLESGLTSVASTLLEPPAPVTTCLNTGNNVSDLGYMTSGYLNNPTLHWLLDGSGLVLPLSYSGEGAESAGSSCIFNYSRLRMYAVTKVG